MGCNANGSRTSNAGKNPLGRYRLRAMNKLVNYLRYISCIEIVNAKL